MAYVLICVETEDKFNNLEGALQKVMEVEIELLEIEKYQLI